MTIGTDLRKWMAIATACSMIAACGDDDDSNNAGFVDDVVSNPPPSAPAPSPSPTNSAPRISGSPPSSIMAGSSFSFTPSASDPDGDTLTFSFDNLPDWIESFDPRTGTISGIPGQGDLGTYSNIVITVSDGSLSDSLSPFSVAVVQTSAGSVELNWTAPTLNTDGSQLRDLTGYAFYYGTSSGSYPNRIQVNDPSLTSYVIDELTPDTYYFVAVAITSGEVESDYSAEAVKQVL